MLLLALALAQANAPGQIVSTTLLNSLTKADINGLMGRFLGSFNGDARYGSVPPAMNGATVWKVVYKSTNFANETVNLSGLVLLPKYPKAFVVMMHGTAVGRDECPSSGLKNPYSFDAPISVAAFASGGYAVALPDYIGQGVSTDVHPYVMPSVNAKSGRDLLIAATTLATQQNSGSIQKVYVTGYSEGGANAMGLTQLLEREPVTGLQFAGAAPCSGPYDLTGAQRKLLVGPIKPNGQLQFAIPLLASFLVYSTRHYYPEVVAEDIFKTSYWKSVPSALDGNTSSENAGQLLAAVALFNGYRKQADGAYHLASLLTPDAAPRLESGDPTFPLNKVMAQYNTFDWLPRTPLYLIGLKQDTIVSFGNAEAAVTAMRARGATSNVLAYYGVDAPNQTHLTNLPGQAILARRFFDGGLAAVPKS